MKIVQKSGDVSDKAYQSHPLADGVPPNWASGWGEDRFGVWVDVVVETVEFRMRWIPPGEFLMGSPKNEPERRDDELLHSVTLTQGYWLAETACTQALWEAVTGSSPNRYFKSLDRPVDLDRPVESVNWDEVKRFIERLNGELPGLQCRLPTEAQWEFAARAGSQTPFWWGSTLSPEQASYNTNIPYADGEKGRYPSNKIALVKEFEPNPWGLYQVHGNVWEWCEDWYGEYEREAVVNPRGAESGERRVCRGGSWLYGGRELRAASRFRGVPDLRNYILGFRLSAGQPDEELRGRKP